MEYQQKNPLKYYALPLLFKFFTTSALFGLNNIKSSMARLKYQIFGIWLLRVSGLPHPPSRGSLLSEDSLIKIWKPL
jgi:hypothetical protein